MAFMKNPVHPFPSTNSNEEDGKKGSRNAEWPVKAVAILLDTYVKKFAAGRGYRRGNDWEEVVMKVNEECEAFKISKTVKQCRDKVDSLKRRYKMEKRKVVNGSQITWPFFTKLDDMMGSVFKQAREFEPNDAQQKASLYYSHGEDEEDDKQEFFGFPGEEYYNTPAPSFLEYGKGRSLVDRGRLSEGGFYVHRRPAFLNLLPQLPADHSNSSGKIRLSPPPLQPVAAARRSEPRKRKIGPEQHPMMRALADAVNGFSEVYAQVELAKLEIQMNMKLELAKLRRKRHKNSSKREQASSSSTASG